MARALKPLAAYEQFRPILVAHDLATISIAHGGGTAATGIRCRELVGNRVRAGADLASRCSHGVRMRVAKEPAAGSRTLKIPANLKSRRSDSNRGPLHYE